MTPKQRFEAAIRLQQPDGMVPFMEIEFHIYKDFIGKEPVVGYDFAKLSKKEREKALYYNAEIMVETAEKAGHDAIKDFAGFWEVAPGVPAYLWLPDEVSRLDQVRALRKITGDRFYIIGSVGATMCLPDGNYMYDFVYDLYENKDKILKWCGKLLHDAVEYQKKAIDAGADGILTASDIAFNNGPFLSPEMLEEFFFPYFIKWVESVKEQGADSIWHTDGNLMVIMDRILETGVNALQCIDPIAGMDIVSLGKKLKNKLAMIGNIDCSLLQNGTPEEVDAAVKNVVLNCKENSGFVLSGCNAIFHGIPVENYMAMVEAREKYGRV